MHADDGEEDEVTVVEQMHGFKVSDSKIAHTHLLARIA